MGDDDVVFDEKLFLTPVELAHRWRTTTGYLANRRYQSKSPKFVKIGAKVLYPLDEVLLTELAKVDRE